MDVTASAGPNGAAATPVVTAEAVRAVKRSTAEVPDQVRRASGETAATAQIERHHHDAAHAPEHTRADPLSPSEVVGAAAPPEFGTSGGDEPGVLKFDVAHADVLARFAIHEATNHVVVTMYQRDTGEVIREFPPRQVLDVMAALAGKGLAIDVKS